MTATVHNLVIEQGTGFALSLAARAADGAAMDLTGWEAVGEVRTAPGGTLLATLHVAIPEPLTGVMMLSLSAAETGVLSFSTAKYDLVLRRPGVVLRLLTGRVILSRRVTQ